MKEENVRELKGAIAKVIEAMANDGDKEMKFAYDEFMKAEGIEC